MGGYDQQLFRISKLLSACVVCVYVLPGPLKRLHTHRLKKNRLKNEYRTVEGGTTCIETMASPRLCLLFPSFGSSSSSSSC